ncbi:EthD family reductase [Acidovorax sp.]|uniref:EthD family reductase n=1 Tax=Acidovorax sp. TaxID=1872122 RepID=UPI002ACF0045|nr:EthD family reductase [Acidovorax sp.]MDZ7865953.1 EthD family reductase [Acidovorax sp.]
MYRITSHYRWSHGARFDAVYYQTEHMRITLQATGPLGLVRLESDLVHRVAPLQAGDLVASTHACFATLSQAQAALAEAGPCLRADLSRYTNIKPELFFVLVSHHSHEG